jgi:hypothetical protein
MTTKVRDDTASSRKLYLNQVVDSFRELVQIESSQILVSSNKFKCSSSWAVGAMGAVSLS